MRSIIPKRMLTSVLNTSMKCESGYRKSNICKLSLIFCLLSVLPFIGFYTFLNSLYLIDEVYDITGPKEYSMDEKLIIRVNSSDNINQLKSFVQHYTLCKSVYEIQIEWADTKKSMPSNEMFTFAHTHSKVTFEDRSLHNKRLSFIPVLALDTKGVLLLDIDVFISCEDLELLHSVWRSSGDALVGLYPRSHKINSDEEFEFLGPMSVWWSGRYSLMLPSAVMLHRKYFHAMSNSSNFDPYVKNLSDLLHKYPVCKELAVVLWTVFQEAPSPIWVDIAKEIKTVKHFKSNKVPNIHDRNDCLCKIAEVLRIKDMEYSTVKSVRASTQIFW
eukprot:gene3048-5969_t